MKVADTSVVVAAFASWHEKHLPARAVIDDGAEIAEHSLLETYSVLTRLPPPHRVAGPLVRDFLAARFSGGPLRLDARSHRAFVLKLPEHGVVGGAAYDALIAATAAHARAEIVTCDRRALPVYERYGLRATVL